MKKNDTNQMCGFMQGNQPSFELLSLSENSEALNITNELLKAFASYNRTIIIRSQEIILSDKLEWNSAADLILSSENNIIFKSNAYLINKANGSISLHAGANNNKGTVIFENKQQPQISLEQNSKVYIYYNPEAMTNGEYAHKYYNQNKYFAHVYPKSAVTSYMLINDVNDLQNMKLFLHGNYALSKDIDASETRFWNSGNGFDPIFLQIEKEVIPFSGYFDGNNFQISNLYINREDEDNVGLFGMTSGSKANKAKIFNLKLNNFEIYGNSYVGGVAGEAEFTIFENIEVANNCVINGKAMVGGLVGSASGIDINNIIFPGLKEDIATGIEYIGTYAGTIRDSAVLYEHEFCYSLNNSNIPKCFGYEINLDWIE